MNVTNVKVANIRPQYQNLKEWMDNPDNVYIGRKGIVFVDGVRFPLKDSIWCNPFKIDQDNDRDKVIDKYKKYIIDKIKTEKLTPELQKLKNKNLGCWCKPLKCHGDILLGIIK